MKELLQKACNFCVYQERSHREVKEKLISWEASNDQAEEVMTWLIENNFLNEGRFAEQFAGGKFRVKGWGRKKIGFELRKKGISENNINEALKVIDDEGYRQTLKELADRKISSLKGLQNFEIRKKVISWLLNKGFEYDIIIELFQSDP